VTPERSVRAEPRSRRKAGGKAAGAPTPGTHGADRGPDLPGPAPPAAGARSRARRRQAELRDGIADALETMTDGLMVVDRDWRLCYLNAAAEKGNGVARKCALGKSFWEVFPAVVGTEADRALRRAMAERVTIDIEFFFPPHGTWYRMNANPVRNGGVAFYGRDITEHRKGEEARLRLQRERDELLQRLRLQFERMPIACFVTDPQSRIVEWNPAAEATFGWRWEEVQGKEAPALLVTPEVRARTAGIMRRLEQGDMAAHSVNENVTRDGRTIVCEWHNTPLQDAAGAVIGIMCMAQDVTERTRAERALHRVTTRLELATRGSDIGVFELEFPDGTFAGGRVVYSNAWEQLGYGRQPLPTFAAGVELAHPDDRAGQQEFFRAFLAGESGHLEFEHRLRHRDGSYRTLLVRGVAVRDPGKPVRVIGSRVDITHRQRAEQALRDSEERFRSAFQAAAIGFALVETDGRFRAVNPSLCEMLGYGEAELLAMTWQDVTHPDDVERDRPLRARMAAGEIESFHLDKRYVHKGGTVVWGQLAVSLVRDASGAPAYTVAQVIDVTARKEAEQALARHAAELERSNAELQQFAAIVSHDLQEPLRTVASYVQLLAERFRGLDERAGRWTGYTVAAVERMQRQVAGLLALAQVRTDRSSLAPASLEAALAHAWEHLRPRHAGSRARLTHGALPTLVADPTQLEQLFQNLLGNALKYRRPGVPPRIHVSAERRATASGAVWELAVRDHGIGVKVEDAGRIFEIFHRLHRNDEYEGTGIGLAICRKIVERHGGRIWVESPPGDGAVFRFTLQEGRE
jgi:PAS domain S-box-containing protein